MSEYELREVEGTIHFDGPMATKGFKFNKMCYSFNSEENRQAFRDDPEGYMETFQISEEQRQAVRDKDIIRMLELGGSIYYMAKFAIIFGWNMQIVGGMQSGRSTEEFKAYLDSQGRGKNNG
ncbi:MULTISPECIES: protocatechuate 3,4-dioxygenase [Oceanospirillaceae]|jgi:protocatechuate 4,5-dioxygenase alpha chain|uniref:Protocatechuate 3,4-dioxygenase n=1 Tax=Oceanobacter antarcticus TaxID=3133425 RepID=A0ABW8NF24_9GAMM|tara:strand:+ start:37617 stop:37982 length:366 start_codon:yes stop_codon:yes gene_type:complete